MRIGKELYSVDEDNGRFRILSSKKPECIAKGNELKKLCDEKHIEVYYEPRLVWACAENLDSPVMIFSIMDQQMCFDYEEAKSWISQQEDGHPVLHNLDIKKYQDLREEILCLNYCLMDPYSTAPTFTSQFGLESDYEDEDFDANPQMGALYDYDMQAYREQMEEYVKETKEDIKRWEKELDELVAQKDRMLKESGILDLPGFTCEG